MKNKKPICCTMSADGAAVMELFCPIGEWGYTLKDFTSALASAPSDKITLRINSPGGEVVEALAIHDLILASEKTITAEVYGLCASAATLVALACDSVRIAANATWMVHEPSFTVSGTLAECDKMRDTMSTLRDKVYAIYAAATGKPVDELQRDHASDRYYTATEAVEYGWCAELMGETQVEEETPAPEPTETETPEEETPAPEPTEAEVETVEDEDDKLTPPQAKAFRPLARLRAMLGLETTEDLLREAVNTWRRRALVAEARSNGQSALLATARAEAAAERQNVEARISAAVASAMAELGAPADLPQPSESIPARPVADLRAIAATRGTEAAIRTATALLN